MKFQLVCEEAIEPKCSHFGKCGGCKYQHIPYDEQLAQKEAFVRSLFASDVDPILPCEPPWRYRNKMEFSFSQARSGEKFLGLMRKRGRVENLGECHLTSSWFIEILEHVRVWWEESGLDAYYPPKNLGALRTLTVREGIYTGEKMVFLTVSGNPEYALDEAQIEGFVDAVGEVDALLLRTQIIAKKTPTRFEERLLAGKAAIHEQMHDAKGNAYTFRIRANAFFQPNTRQAEALYQLALEYAELGSDETVLDLYCGTGTLGIFAARRVKNVVGVEIVPEAVLDAQENLQLNAVDNMEVLEGDVGKMGRDFAPTTVIVDPPRPGLEPKALENVLSFSPQKIVYISCNPVTQAENCKELVEAGYEIVRLQPVDQFPHTPHVENIAILHKKC